MSKIITFEGIDGSGKTTLIPRIRKRLEENGHLCWQSSEPRSYVTSTDPFVATMQLMADRRAHCQLIKRLSKTNDLILIDRFDLSTEAYQGWGDGLSISLIQRLNDIATEHVDVNLRLWLDIPVDVAVQRIQNRGESVSAAEIARLERVRAGYAELADEGWMEPVNATQPPDDVLREAIALIEQVL